MTSLMRSLLFLVACWTVTEASKKTDNVLDFMSVVNGIFNNKAQVEKVTKGFNFLQLRIVPVKVPAFCQEPVVFVELWNNNLIFAFNLAVITEDSEKNIFLTIYNFTDTKPTKFGTYDLANLAKVKREDLSHERACVTRFALAGKGVYFGSWPDCTQIVNGIHPMFADTFTCDDHLAFPMIFVNSSVPPIFNYDRFGPRFPLINAPDNYVSPCEKNY